MVWSYPSLSDRGNKRKSGFRRPGTADRSVIRQGNLRRERSDAIPPRCGFAPRTKRVNAPMGMTGFLHE
jgi:hypothetical protein